ncbi:hypothetical protein UP12_19250 (plasmid) [Bacillus pumilus]|uniref:hypothetical protein n=1 Tax=Bacillus TaxID=1386 RepID=UPI000776177F|nr:MULTISPECIES: hypothetical protein [Bacillus]AMM99552.1 hypothetical protein UP12_19250 [Bacillus pumilus]
MRGKGFWYLVAEEDLFEMVEKSGYGEAEFIHFQKKRLRNAILSMIGAVLPALILSPWLGFLAIFFFTHTWRQAYVKEKIEFRDLLYEKQINWFVFQRLVVNFVKSNNGSIIIGLRKVLDQLEPGEFKDHIFRLINNITKNPGKVDPYLQFSEEAAGGTDGSKTFMTSLYNYKHNSADPAIIDNLNMQASKAMMESVKMIRLQKENRFALYPTKMTMLNVIIMFGFMAGVAVTVITKNMNF